MEEMDGSADRLAVERSELRLGFIALADCAPLVVAKERGFFSRHGLKVTLERQASWANIRDKVTHGLLDGAQMLAPMPLAASLGLEGLAAPMLVPLGLSLGGNAITLSSGLLTRLHLDRDEGFDGPIALAHALRDLIREDQEHGRPKLRFAVVYPYSSHFYQLCYWMAAGGIHPMRDIAISVIPPAAMVTALQRGEIDGYAVGEPWNQLAADRGIGVPVVSSNEIWQSPPEKVLSVTREWAEQHPGTLQAMVRALLEASLWIDEQANRLETVHVIAGESYVDAPVDALRGSMERVPQTSASADRAKTQHVFHRQAANYPWVSHAEWFLTQMLRWGQIEKPLRIEAAAAEVYRPDLYGDAAEALGIALPEIDRKQEGAHDRSWRLDEATPPIAMGPDAFLDGRLFQPEDPVGYLEHFEVSALRVRLDDLALHNA